MTSNNGTYDFIIIGTGAGGGTLARHLAPSGKKILLLERGDWLRREPENWSAQDVFVDNRYVSSDVWYDGTGKAFQPQVHYFVGGSTKLYGAALYRMRREDFGELRHQDGISPAWPITYDENGALLHSRGAALSGPRRSRRGPDGTTCQRALSIPGGITRAANPATLGRPCRGGSTSVPCAERRHAR